jgi:hypothetical protein
MKLDLRPIKRELCSLCEDWYLILMEFDPVCPPSIILCDNVIVEHGTQKLTLVGCFHAFNVPQFPFTTARFFAVVSLGNLHGISPEIDVTIRIEMAQTAHPVSGSTIHIKGDFTRASQLPEAVIQLPVPIGPLVLAQPGLYKAVLLVNGSVVNSRDFRVNSITANPQIS